jgi:acetyl esterase/lipase
MGRISRSARARVLGINYRLAPEFPFPAALEDATAAYRWLIANDVKASDVVVVGDSAGGGLSLSTLVSLRDATDPLPAAVVCLSPWVDMEATGDSMTTKATIDPVNQREAFSTMQSSISVTEIGRRHSFRLSMPISRVYRASNSSW